MAGTCAELGVSDPQGLQRGTAPQAASSVFQKHIVFLQQQTQAERLKAGETMS